jgi:hypothetical protein
MISFLSVSLSLIFIYFLSAFTNFSDGYDISRHRSAFKSAIDDIDIYRSYYYSGDKLDILFYFIIDLGSMIGLNEVNFFAVLILFIFLLLYFSLKYINPNANKNLVLIIALLVFVNMSLLSGIRFYLGLSFLSIALVFNLKNKIIYSILFFLLAISTHFSLIIYFPLIFINKVRLNYPIFYYFFFFILVIFSSYYLFDIINLITINNIYFNHIVNYLYNESPFDRIFIYYFLHYSPIIVSLFILKDLAFKKFSFSLLYSLLIIFINVNNLIFFDRAFLVYMLILAMFFLSNYRSYSFSLRSLYILTCMLFFITEVHSNLELYL